MRCKSLRRYACAVCALVSCSPAIATFHLMQIEQVIGGVNGDTSVQAIQLRMRAGGQCFLEVGRLVALDAAGANPVVLVDFSECPAFPTPCVAACSSGAQILITSANFSDFVNAPLTGDFTLENLIPASYLVAGSLTFETDLGIIYWRLSWGGGSYTGLNGGACDNDDSPCPTPGDFGPPWPGPLPSDGVEALLFQGSATELSTTNADDYDQTKGAALFTNNDGQSASVSPGGGSPCPWDLDGNGVVDGVDLFLLLLSAGPCAGDCPADFDGDGVVGLLDLFALLQNTGPCPVDCPWDFNGNGVVGNEDLLSLVLNAGPCGDPENCPWDLDGNGVVGFFDLVDVFTNLGPCPG